MKRSFWMVAALLAGVVGLIAVAQAQKSLRYSELGASIGKTDDEWDGEAPSEDPWSDPLAVGTGTGGTVDPYATEQVQLAAAQDTDSAEDDTIPPGPGLDFRRFGTGDELGSEEQNRGLDAGAVSAEPDEPLVIGEGDEDLRLPNAAGWAGSGSGSESRSAPVSCSGAVSAALGSRSQPSPRCSTPRRMSAMPRRSFLGTPTP